MVGVPSENRPLEHDWLSSDVVKFAMIVYRVGICHQDITQNERRHTILTAIARGYFVQVKNSASIQLNMKTRQLSLLHRGRL